MTRRLRFATLGPAGTNSHQATQRYIAFHGLVAEIVLVRDFLDASDRLLAGEFDHVVQVCAHPDVAATIERHHDTLFVVDSFIAPTRPMGLLARADVARPRSVGFMPATRGYFDTAAFEVLVHEISNAEVEIGLLEGRYEAGFTALGLLETHPGRFRLEKRIGEVDVAWLVYGRERLRQGDITAWPDSPLARTLKGRAAA
jgi:hypothetical protein